MLGFAHCSAKCLRNCKRYKSYQHYGKILLSVAKRFRHFPRRQIGIEYFALGSQKQFYKRFAKKGKNHNCGNGNNGTNNIFKAQRLANTLFVAFSVKLRRENTRARYCSEYREVKYENKLVDYCNAGHLKLAFLSDHYIIQKADEIGYSVLKHNRKRDSQHCFIKFFIAYVFF